MLLAIIEYNIHNKNLVADNADDEIQTVPKDESQDEKGICETFFLLKCLCIVSNYTK